jgi:hypothetical protein
LLIFGKIADAGVRQLHIFFKRLAAVLPMKQNEDYNIHATRRTLLLRHFNGYDLHVAIGFSPAADAGIFS